METFIATKLNHKIKDSPINLELIDSQASTSDDTESSPDQKTIASQQVLIKELKTKLKQVLSDKGEPSL